MRLKLIVGNLIVVLLVGLGSYLVVRTQLQTGLSRALEERIDEDSELFARSWRADGAGLVEGVSDRASSSQVRHIFTASGVAKRRGRAFSAAQAVSKWFQDPARGRRERPHIVAVIDETGRVIARDTDPNRMFGQSLLSAVPVVRQVLESGAARYGVWLYQGKLVQVAVAAVRNDDGGIVGTLLVGYDLSNGFAQREAALYHAVKHNGGRQAEQRGSTARQRVVTAPLRELALRTREAGLSAPTIVVVGEVTRFRENLAWFERRPLFGRRVLVPRAAGQQGTLAIELQRRGAEPVRVALLEFREPEDLRGLEEATANAGRYDWIVFTSANAVRFCQPYLGSAATLGDVRVACIGQATAAAAARAGLPVHVVPPERSLPGELAAAMQARSPLRDASVLFPHASRAREELPRILEAAGAKVDAVEAYRTALPEAAAREVGAALREGLEAVTLTSPSTADHFFACLEAEELAPLARELVFACIGPSTAAALERHGVVPHAVAERQTSEALAEALEAVFAESGRDVS